MLRVMQYLEKIEEMKVAYYQAPISGFLSVNEPEILGELILSHGFVLEQEQRNAWLEQIPMMRQAVRNFVAGHILFEFVIPRMGKRADVVLVIEGTILVWNLRALQNSSSRQLSRRMTTPWT